MNGQTVGASFIQYAIFVDLAFAGATPIDRSLFRAETPTSLDAFGETFRVDSEDGEVVISHPQWSLGGRGHDLRAARQELCAEACELAHMMRNDRRDDLTEAAWLMREFALRVKASTTVL